MGLRTTKPQRLVQDDSIHDLPLLLALAYQIIASRRGLLQQLMRLILSTVHLLGHYQVWLHPCLYLLNSLMEVLQPVQRLSILGVPFFVISLKPHRPLDPILSLGLELDVDVLVWIGHLTVVEGPVHEGAGSLLVVDQAVR